MRSHRKTRFVLAASAGVLLAFAAGCTTTISDTPSADMEIDYAELPGDPAVWRIVPGSDIDPDDNRLPIEVTRVGCANGVTGAVLDPVVEYNETQVVITQRVESLPPGGYTCQGNDLVPKQIELTEKVGDRELVDGECLYGDNGHTIFCDTPSRWDPKTGTPESLW
mgnify:CR=1 FL=1